MNPADLVKPQPARWKIVLAFALVYITWGTTYLATTLGVRDEHLPPTLFGGTRLCMAGAVLLSILAWRGDKLRVSRRDATWIIVCGWLLFVGGNGLINHAQTMVPSGTTAVLVATTPLWIGIFAMAWPRSERLSVTGWLGLLLGLVGVLVLLLPRLQQQDGAQATTYLGPLLVLGSAASWALGSLVVRHARIGASSLISAAYQMLVGGACLVCLGISMGELELLPASLSFRAGAVWMYLLVVGSLLGFVSFNWLLQHVSAAQVGTYAYVNPMVAVVVAWLWDTDEVITGWMFGGIAVILTGVALVRNSRERPSPAPLPPSIHPVQDEMMKASLTQPAAIPCSAILDERA